MKVQNATALIDESIRDGHTLAASVLAVARTGSFTYDEIKQAISRSVRVKDFQEGKVDYLKKASAAQSLADILAEGHWENIGDAIVDLAFREDKQGVQEVDQKLRLIG